MAEPQETDQAPEIAEAKLRQPMDIYEMFETDTSLENEGVWFQFGFGDFKLAYVGGEQGFQNEYAERMRPHAEAQARKMLDPEIHRKILVECYAKHILKDWRDVKGPSGEIPFSEENAIKLLLDLPRLFDILRDAAMNFANYRKIYAEDVGKNS